MVRRNERKLEVRITSEANQFDRGFKKATNSTRTLDQQMRTASRGGIRQFNSGMDIGIGKVKGFLGLLAGAAATKLIFGWAGALRESANSLSESVNAINVVFGEASDTILKFGQTSATSVGLAQSAFNAAVVPIGSLLRNFGFTAQEAADATLKLTTRAADLGSVFNEVVQQPLEAIASGLKGEANPLEKYGAGITAARVEQLLLNEGIVATKNAITDQDKVMGRYLLILQDTERVSGDFAATAGEDANATRIFQASLEDLKEEVGKNVIPIYEELVGLGMELLPALETLGTEAVPLLAAQFLNFVAGVRALVEGFDAMGVSVGQGIVGVELLGVGLLALSGHPIVAGLAIVATAIGVIGSKAQADRDEVQRLTEDLIELGKVTPVTVESLIGDNVLAELDDVNISLTELVGFLESDTFRNANRGEFFGDLTAEGHDITRFQNVWDDLVHLQNQFRDATAEATQAQRIQRLEFSTTESLSFQIAQAQTGPQVRPDLTDDLEDEKAAVDALTKKYEDLDKQIEGLADTYATQLTSAAQGWIDIFEEAPELGTIGIDQIVTNAEERISQVDRFIAGLGRLQEEGLFALETDFRDQGPAAVADLEAFIADIDAGGAAAFNLDELLETSRSEIGRLAEDMGQVFADEKAPLLVQAEDFGREFVDAIAAGLDGRHLELIISASTRGRATPATGPGSLFPSGDPRLTDVPSTELFRTGVAPQQFSTAAPAGVSTGDTIIVNVGGIDARGATDPQAVGRETTRAISTAVKRFDAGQRRPF